MLYANKLYIMHEFMGEETFNRSKCKAKYKSLIIKNMRQFNIFEQVLTQKISELEKSAPKREEKRLSLALLHIFDGISTEGNQIEQLMKATKGRCQKEIQQMVVKEIIRAADGDLWSQDFVQNTNAEQNVFCYIGSHWMKISSPQWKQFVRDSAVRCGVPESLTMDPIFMKKLQDTLSYNVFKDRQAENHDNEVWLNLRNGTLVMKEDGTSELRPHRKEDLLFYELHYAYDPKADCPEFRNFINRVLPDEQVQRLVKEFIAYMFMRDHRYEKILWLVGEGQNGKSTLLIVLEALLGSENVSNLSLDQLTNDQIMRSSFEHKLANFSSETGRDINVSVMKRICSGEAVTVEQKYVNPREIRDYGKVVVATNECPRPENTSAFFRRIIILPFQTVITDEEKDVLLADKLKKELPGILNWALEALPALIERGAFTTCEISERALEEYRMASDSVSLFNHEMLEQADVCTDGKTLFISYQVFCRDSGLNPVGKTTFYKRLDRLTHSGEKKGRCQYFKLKVVS